MTRPVNRNNTVLDDRHVGRLLVKLSLPAFMGMFVMTMYNVIDTIFIGHYVGPLGIAGLSIVFPIQMLSMGIGTMMGMGGASLASRLIGAGDIPRTERVLGNVITATGVLSLLLTVAGLANTDYWLRLIGSSETILPYARDYLSIVLIGLVFQTMGMALNNMVRAEGNARVAMTTMIVGALLNILLDTVFIIPLKMGIRGAALATILSQFVMLAYLGGYYCSGRSFIAVHARNLVVDWSLLAGILAIGIASFARTLATSLSAMLVNRLLVGYGGDMAISAFGIINRIVMFAMMPGIAIGQGLQPILGYNYGARHYGRALKVILIAMAAATAFCVAVFVVLYADMEMFIRVFTTDAELIALGTYAGRRIFLVLYLLGFIMVGSLVFQSIGLAYQSFITSIARSALFLIPLLFVVPRYLGLDGVWLAFPLADALTVILTAVLLVPQLKKLGSAGRPA